MIPDEPGAQWVSYGTYPAAFGSIGRPVVTVDFISRNARYPMAMLVDPGADEIVLPYYALELLHLSEEDCQPESRARSIYGLMDRLRGPAVRLEFPDLWEDWGFEAEVVFSRGAETFEYGLLGREPTLDHLNLTFGHEIGYGFQMEPRL